MSNLFRRCIEVIKENQSTSGAYPAGPTFPKYQYCWFRDSSFCAYAMNLVGEHDSATQFHKWASRTVINNAEIIKRAVKKSRRGVPLDTADTLHTRYTLNGETGSEDWPNFQLDGFGTWLWSLQEYQRLVEYPLDGIVLEAAQLVADYIEALWSRSCFDCWEEFPDKIHTYTLGSIFAGLSAAGELIDKRYNTVRDELKDFIYTECTAPGYFVKYVGIDTVDASLLGLSIPYKVIPVDDPLMVATVAQIESRLRSGGGVHRYTRDTYYGGGEWVLLTGWLGWYYAQIGKFEQARELLGWMEGCASQDGNLPEQVPLSLNDQSYYEPWRKRWGEIASPLLWSHAKYLILSKQIS